MNRVGGEHQNNDPIEYRYGSSDYARLNKLFARYDDMLSDIGIKEGEQKIDTPYDLAHIKWMCEQMLLVTNGASQQFMEKDIGKVNRWLGYIQGALTSAFIIDLQEEIIVVREVLEAS
jgi:hypothetical protein